MDVSENVIPALLLTAVAGLSTGIGSAIAYFIRKPKVIYLSISLGFSAGVMIYISFMELLADAMETVGQFRALIAFFGGIVTFFDSPASIPASASSRPSMTYFLPRGTVKTPRSRLESKTVPSSSRPV